MHFECTLTLESVTESRRDFSQTLSCLERHLRFLVEAKDREPAAKSDSYGYREIETGVELRTTCLGADLTFTGTARGPTTNKRSAYGAKSLVAFNEDCVNHLIHHLGRSERWACQWGLPSSLRLSPC